MRFNVVRPRTDRLRNGANNTQLVNDGVKNFLWTNGIFSSSKIFPVEQTWMRTHGHAFLLCCLDGLAHGVGIARVKTAGNAGGADEPEQLGIMAGAFTEIGVQIDGGLHAARASNPTRNKPRSRSR